MPISKRELIIGGLSIIFGGHCGSCLAGNDFGGCSISIDEAQRLAKSDSGSTDFGLVANSGNREFDYNAAETLSKISSLLNIRPGFLYFKNYSFNAWAAPVSIFPNTWGTVGFGRDLLFSIIKNSEDPIAAFDGICAHECTHIYQFINRINPAYGQVSVKRNELHADFFSGYFAGIRKIENRNYNAAVVAVSHQSLGDYNFNNPQHHGTPEERAAAVVRGFEVAYNDRLPVNAANLIALEFVSRI